MSAYYNEFDKKAAAWLRELINGGHIAPGDVDERSIVDVRAADLVGYTQCHFFAGIGGWSVALRLAGWPDDEPAWTGSCPCQPFSAAGKQAEEEDPRHLWPHLFRLISESRPDVCFGEQVAGAAGLRWLAGVHADLEKIAYRLGTVELCAASKGAPHIRQRSWWVADSKNSDRWSGECREEKGVGPNGEWRRRDRLRCEASRLEHANQHGLESRRLHQRSGESRQSASVKPRLSRVSLAGGEGLSTREQQTVLGAWRREEGRAVAEPCGTRFWDDYDIIPCLDGKARRVEAGTFPLAHGIPARVGRLRGYGNAIVPAVAAEFIQAYVEVK